MEGKTVTASWTYRTGERVATLLEPMFVEPPTVTAQSEHRL
jgi:hypothetical protein